MARPFRLRFLALALFVVAAAALAALSCGPNVPSESQWM
jgi:hypothetical protein